MRRLNCSRRSFSSSSPRSLGALSRKSLAFMYAPSCPDLALDERRRYGQLGGGQTERPARGLPADAFDLEQHLAGKHLRHPVLDVALARTHAHLERLLSDRHIRENPDPNAAAALDVAGNRPPRRLDLSSRHAAPVGRLQAELAERNGIAALRAAGNLALELFAELGPLRLHHAVLPIQPAAGAGASADLGRAAAASASASTASASGASNTSPLNIQTLMPMTPYVVCASAVP